MLWRALPLLWALFFVGVAQAQQAAIAGYTPHSAPCPPNFQLVRDAGQPGSQSLSANESNYVSQRLSNVLPAAWKDYFTTVNATTTNATLPAYVGTILSGSNTSNLPKLGIAVSGGGYRAAIFGGGVLNALDGRNETSKKVGTGGLLQAATYLSALSGGSWLLTSLTQANFPTIQEVVFGSEDGSQYTGWNADSDILVNTTQFGLEIIQEVGGKHAAGYPVSVGDLWSRSLARHFVNGTTPKNFNSTTDAHGAGILFSQFADLPVFKSHQAPLPIILGNVLTPGGTTGVPQQHEVYEFNLYEIGSFDPNLAAFAPIKFLGSTNSSVCITNFDQASLITGVSSELFNEFNSSVAAFNTSSVGPLVQGLDRAIPQPHTIRLDSTIFPNPFIGVDPSRYANSNQTYLSMVDGGEDGEIIPIQPLLVKARDVDVIIAVDGVADTEENYAAGSSMIATQNRVNLYPSAYSFPPVPNDTTTFISQNLSSRPTFFGCTSSPTSTPLVIYLANGAAPPGQPNLTNTDTFQTVYEDTQIRAMLEQTFTIATQGREVNGSATDAEWGACLACAVVERRRQALGFEREGICESCFERYCFDANVASTAGGTQPPPSPSGSGTASGSSPSSSGTAGGQTTGSSSRLTFSLHGGVLLTVLIFFMISL